MKRLRICSVLVMNPRSSRRVLVGAPRHRACPLAGEAPKAGRLTRLNAVRVCLAVQWPWFLDTRCVERCWGKCDEFSRICCWKKSANLISAFSVSQATLKNPFGPKGSALFIQEPCGFHGFSAGRWRGRYWLGISW